VSEEKAINRFNQRIVSVLQHRGLAVPSITQISGKLAIRVNLTNHRTRTSDLRKLITDILAISAELSSKTNGRK
jgi:glutamate/tyrosine decarboxylase-like PLP-dependent enzyme